MNFPEKFTLKELIRSAKAKEKGINNTPSFEQVENLRELAVCVLDPVRVLLGTVVTITSGYRCPELNKLLGGATDSQHTLGEAADFIPKGINVLEAARMIATSEINLDQIIYERNAKGTEWIHISYRKGNNRNEILTKISGQPYKKGLPR